MGFFLLKEIEKDAWFAVNPAYVEDIIEEPDRCLLKLSVKIAGHVPLASGTAEDIYALIKQASKVGLRKVEAEILAGGDRTMPLLLNQPDRVILARELDMADLKKRDIDRPAATLIYMSDGTERIIAGRPGAFAVRANAGGKAVGA